MQKHRPRQSPRMLALIKKYIKNSKLMVPIKPKKLRARRLNNHSMKRSGRKPSVKRSGRKPSVKRRGRKPSVKRSAGNTARKNSIKIKTIAQRIAELKEKIKNSTAKQRLNNNASKVRNRTKKVSNRVRGYYKRFM
jgi:hypothetical protein